MKNSSYFVLILFVCFLGNACTSNTSITHTLVKQKGNITQVLSKENNAVLYESLNAKESIEWALSKSSITVVLEGFYKLSSQIDIPRENISLIISEKAMLQTKRDAQVIKVSEEHGAYYPMIYNKGHNNVNVFNFGTLNPSEFLSTEKEAVNVCIMYDGRNNGTNGIHGGVIFSSGKMLTSGDAVWLIDSKNIQVPLQIGRAHV